jgi:DnaJ-domain-containing protein 1
MTRFAVIIICIAVGYYMFRYVIRRFIQGIHKKDGEGDHQYQVWERANTENDYRQILGVTADDDLATIRKRYKELLAQYHPDKVQHLGIEFREMAERKTRAIMEAYEFLRKKHDL